MTRKHDAERTDAKCMLCGPFTPTRHVVPQALSKSLDELAGGLTGNRPKPCGPGISRRIRGSESGGRRGRRRRQIGASKEDFADEPRGKLDSRQGDVAPIMNAGVTELLLSFRYLAAADAPYMAHCHILEHEDSGMMTQFAVA